MPTPRLNHHETQWTDADKAFLATGRDYFHETAFAPFRSKVAYRMRECAGDVDLMRQAWEELRDEITADWIADRPGSRPWAWWAFEATDRRRCTNQTHPHDDIRRKAKIAKIANQPGTSPEYTESCYRLSFGVPSSLVYFSSDGSPDDTTAEYESEANGTAVWRARTCGDSGRRREFAPARIASARCLQNS